MDIKTMEYVIKNRQSDKYKECLDSSFITFSCLSVTHGNIDSFKFVEDSINLKNIPLPFYLVAVDREHFDMVLHLINKGYVIESFIFTYCYYSIKTCYDAYTDDILRKMLENVPNDGRGSINVSDIPEVLTVSEIKIFREFGVDFSKYSIIDNCIFVKNMEVLEELILAGAEVDYLNTQYKDILLDYLYNTKAYDALFSIKHLLEDYYYREIVAICKRREKRCDVTPTFSDVEFIFNE